MIFPTSCLVGPMWSLRWDTTTRMPIFDISLTVDQFRMEWAGAVIRKIQGDKPPYNDLSVMTSSHQDTSKYCWFRNPKQSPFWCANTGINYQASNKWDMNDMANDVILLQFFHALVNPQDFNQPSTTNSISMVPRYIEMCIAWALQRSRTPQAGSNDNGSRPVWVLNAPKAWRRLARQAFGYRKTRFIYH